MPLPLLLVPIVEGLIAALETGGLLGGAEVVAATAAELAPTVAAGVTAGTFTAEAGIASVAAAHLAEAGVAGATAAGTTAGTVAGTTAATAAGTAASMGSKGSKVGGIAKSIASKLPGESIAGKGYHALLGAGGVIFSVQMIKDVFQRNPELAQQVANGDENAINELAQMMQGAQQGGRGNTQEQYNAIKGRERVNTIESYLGANAPGAPKGVLGNRNDLQHLIQGHQNMLDKVGHQEPMSMLEAYARQGIVPPQGAM